MAFYQQRSRAGEAARRRADRDAARRLDPISEPDASRFVGGIADHAALHDADRGHLAGPVVLPRAVAARRRLRRARSRSRRRHAVRARARRRALGSRRARDAARAGVAEDLRVERAAHLHSAAAASRPTNRGSCSARSSRRSWQRGTHGWPPSSARSARGRAGPSTWTSCRTFSARRSPGVQRARQ